MARVVRFLAVLVVGLGLLAWGGFRIISHTTQAWFEKDLTLRAQLAVNGARWALAARWASEDAAAIRDILAEITRDERIMAAAACTADARSLAATSEYPGQFSCRELGRRVRPNAAAPPDQWRTVGFDAEITGGNVHISVVPLAGDEGVLGFVVLVHDRAFIDRREAKVQELILIAFLILAASASLITVVAARLFWKGWTREIRSFLRGGPQRREFQPILRDVRELIERISAERALEGEGGAWTPRRLVQTLTEHLHGEKVIVLANREPYIHERGPDGALRVVHPASGLVTAIEPIMRACGGVWVAHGGGSADHDTVDREGRIRVPPGEESYALRRVWLSAAEEQGYYYGFSNEGLWPLCHIADTRPLFRREDWAHYQAVNQKFADAVCRETESDDPIVLVQDYHFALAPGMIRQRLPRATIISFWHIPWPNSERFGICPWREELLQGMLGSSIIGFHTQFHCNNFLDAIDRYLEARIDREQIAVTHQRHSTRVRAYPISIEWPNRWLADLPSAEECRREVFRELNLPPQTLLGVGVDRLDYTKGVEERLGAVEQLLERHPEFHGRFTFVQLAAPSRTLIERYRQLNDNVERLAARINQRFASGSYRPLVLLRAHHEPPTVFRYYRAADVCYVSSLHDGMNLVAKEFVAAREDLRGVLVLSHFAGASRELTEALIVNPYDMEESSAALAAALRMPVEEQQERLRAMRSLVAAFNVYRWAGRMLLDAARLRSKDRLFGRLSDASGRDLAGTR
ncbi:MAG: trehalose-6-phosphate synthase [Planctomycetes bacterium]|nr:trehalose-6-phosphate synthase [Planctomycetota bacterium]